MSLLIDPPVTRPTITQYASIKLNNLKDDADRLSDVILNLCSPRSLIYHADQFHYMADKFRLAADILDERASVLRGRGDERS